MAFSNPQDFIVFPAGAGTGTPRMVVGGNTPPELQLYGIDQAILAYVTDVVTGIEVGYLWIGSSNRFDGLGNGRVLAYGNVTYPVAGDPTSPTMSDVFTNFQQNMHQQFPETIFKDHAVQVWSRIQLDVQNGFSTFNSNRTGPGGSTIEMPRGIVESGISSVGIGGVVAETVFPAASWTHEPNMTFYDNHIYQIGIQVKTNANAAGDNTCAIILRKGSAAIAGQFLWRWDFECNNLFASGSKYGVGWIKNVSGANITTALTLTAARSGGANQIAMGGDANGPLILTVQDLGVRLDDFSNNNNVAVDRLATAIV